MSATDRRSENWIAMPERPSLAAAERAANIAMARASELGIAIAVAVLDGAGQTICLMRMDGARPVAAELAQAKARTAAMLHRATDDLQKMALPGNPAFGIQYHAPGDTSILPGGLPVLTTRGLHAAVGVSGADRVGDISCAEAARSLLLDNNPE